tara:strand:- start:563 stop:835 length:273 start_codon:yes stop_codon:yes gene_type:complete
MEDREEMDEGIAQELAADVVLALCDALGEWRSKTDLGPYGCGETKDDTAFWAVRTALDEECRREIEGLEISLKDLICEAIQTARSDLEHD